MADNAPVTLADLEAAHRRIAPYILRTPLLRCDALDEVAKGRVLAKAECLQGTGSFKLRGGLNHILSLTEDEKARGVVAYSSGNHAQGVARAAKMAGVPAAIVMPADAPEAKRTRTARDGAEVILYDRENESREEIGARLAEERGAKLVPPFDHPLTVAGQGTAGLELAEDMEGPIDQVVICASGGGLAAGIGIAVRASYPDAEIIVVEPEGFDDLGRSLATGERQANTQRGGSICDALLVEMPGAIPFDILRGLDARGVTVSDDEALSAMAFALHELKVVVEPGGAVALAAVLNGKVDTASRSTAIILSGGNADPSTLARALKEN
ncbi:threonine ammonia-lyase [Parvularcula lutaonensis]|uniref:Threonine/serine dehydratase n=1 Tax=Parvularcula lutaonensis TaxID=491923 RepID=A0ABV7M944_9PROT|nr:threonine/serine dehydratase [Parvularcula lutaonensis]GGY45820.1 serine/threonine dehydratase [Parvularcula lutaonensis]